MSQAGGAETYRRAGVDLAAADEAMGLIKPLIKSTQGPEVMAGMGAFAGLWRLPGGEKQVLAATIDGVGTKVKLAQMLDQHEDVGRDIVNHCVNDLLASGAKPAFFLDYFACGELAPAVLAQIVKGMTAACREAGCALLGGETAEMPDCYPAGEYDLAGCMVGLADERLLPGAHRVREGDRILGLPSDGLHTNGYSLARRVLFQEAKLDLREKTEGLERTLGDELLRPHRSYLSTVGPYLEEGLVSALAHVTGGGVPGNLNRVIPAEMDAVIQSASWPVPPVFSLIARRGKIPAEEMREVFNMGLGMLVVLPSDHAERMQASLKDRGEDSYLVGKVTAGTGLITYVSP